MYDIEISANVKIPFSIRKWSKSLFAFQFASRTNSNNAVRIWRGIALPALKMIRLRKGIRVTIGSSEVDTNTAQNHDKLKIDFHFPLIKNLSEWTDLVSDKASLCPLIMFAEHMALWYFYADQVKTLLLRWTFPCVAINFVLLKSKRCLLFPASFILWFTPLQIVIVICSDNL